MDLTVFQGHFSINSNNVLGQHMLPLDAIHLEGRPCLQKQDNAKPHSACTTTTWLCDAELACVRSRPTGNNYETKKYDTRRM